jgi:hypothetical protein
MNSKGLPLGILVAVLVAAALRMSGVRFFGGGADPRSQEFLAQVAAGISKDAPITIDSDTEMIGAEGLDGVLVYNYRLVGLSLDQLDTARAKEAIEQQVTEGACRTPQTRQEFLDQGITLRYSYFDKNLRPVTQIDVTVADCGS